MEHKVLSYSIVGAWKSVMTQIPVFDRKFCLDLYQDPYNTQAGVSNEGMLISRPVGPPPHRSVLISPQRLQIVDNSPDAVAEVYERIIEQIMSHSNGALPLFFMNIGLNTEHEWLGLEKDCSTWLTEKFLSHGFSKPDVLARTLRIEFEVQPGDDRTYNILLEPRGNNSAGLFGAINDHRIWNTFSLPNREEVKDLLQGSVEDLRSNVFELFL